MAKRPKASRKMSAPKASSRTGDAYHASFFDKVRSAFNTLTAIFAFISSVLGALVIYATNKGAFSELIDDYYRYAYSDVGWTGMFNNFPEGYVDMASMNLSDTDMTLVMIAKHGKLDGVMAGKDVCASGLPFDYVLIDGETELFGYGADITAFEFVGGHRKVLAKFHLRRDGILLDVFPKMPGMIFGEVPFRIARHPDMTPDEAMDSLRGFCAR